MLSSGNPSRLNRSYHHRRDGEQGSNYDTTGSPGWKHVVDAVEIDPAILDIGRRFHPERPYDSPRLHVHVTDARAFLKRTQAKYDLVLFGLLDSHTELSDYSNVGIDNFVYTEDQEGKWIPGAFFSVGLLVATQTEATLVARS